MILVSARYSFTSSPFAFECAKANGCSTQVSDDASLPPLGPTPTGIPIPGTICSPLRKLYAQRIPGHT
jgi:hypothetical protein